MQNLKEELLRLQRDNQALEVGGPLIPTAIVFLIHRVRLLATSGPLCKPSLADDTWQVELSTAKKLLKKSHAQTTAPPTVASKGVPRFLEPTAASDPHRAKVRCIILKRSCSMIRVSEDGPLCFSSVRLTLFAACAVLSSRISPLV